MSSHWYVLHVNPHKERFVHQLLESREVMVYFPSIRVKPKNPTAAKVRPYFPRYLFVRLDLESQEDYKLQWLPGIQGLVRFGDILATVPDVFIQMLKNQLATLVDQQGQRQNDLQAGDRIRIVKGPLAGYKAVFNVHLSGKERVRVLLSLLNHTPWRLELDEEDIAKLE